MHPNGPLCNYALDERKHLPAALESSPKSDLGTVSGPRPAVAVAVLSGQNRATSLLQVLCASPSHQMYHSTFAHSTTVADSVVRHRRTRRTVRTRLPFDSLHTPRVSETVNLGGESALPPWSHCKMIHARWDVSGSTGTGSFWRTIVLRLCLFCGPDLCRTCSTCRSGVSGISFR